MLRATHVFECQQHASAGNNSTTGLDTPISAPFDTRGSLNGYEKAVAAKEQYFIDCYFYRAIGAIL